METSGVSVLDFGAVGDGVTDDAAAIQAAIDHAANVTVNREDAVVRFPGGHRDYAVGTTLNWPRGVSLVGGRGGRSGAWRFPQIKWVGAAGGTLISMSGSDNYYWTEARQLYFVGNQAAVGGDVTVIDANEQAGANWDTFSGFYDCQIGGAAIGIRLRKGPTNFHLERCRLDNLTHAVWIDTLNNTSIITMNRIEFDNGSAPAAGSLLKLPMTTVGGSFVLVSINDSRLEINGPINGLVEVDPHASLDGYLDVKFDTCWAQGGGAFNKPWVHLSDDKPLFVDATWINCRGQLTQLYGGAVTPIAGNALEQVTIVKDGTVTRL